MVRPKKSSYDDLETDYFDEEVGGSFLSLMSLGVAFLAVAAFIALAWYAYQGDDNDSGEIETIYAEEGDFRVEPEGESGWQFPDEERQVYNLGSGEEEDLQVEQILPQPERPQPRATVTEQAEGWINKQVASEEIGLTDAERRKMEELAENAAKTPVKDLVKETEKAIVAAVEKPKPVVAPVLTKKLEKPKLPQKMILTRHRLQLGAFGSRAEALKNWSKIQKKSGSLLANKKAHVQVAEVKGKTYYRVQAYPFSNRAQADALCVMLKARGQACFTVKK